MRSDLGILMADAVLLLALLVACATDLRARKIPDVLTVPVLFVGIGIALVRGEVWFALLGVATALIIHLPLYALGVDRAGDTKLMLAVGALVGWWRRVLPLASWGLRLSKMRAPLQEERAPPKSRGGVPSRTRDKVPSRTRDELFAMTSAVHLHRS